MRSIALLTFFLLAGLTGSTQFFGGFPPSTRWRQIDTDTARVIYTAGAAEQAGRIASLIHRMAGDTSLLFNSRLRKINVLLQSQTTQANGYVALAPFRSEFYLVPSSNILGFGSLPWYENLAIHEYRHVQQYTHFNRGLSKAFSFVFGQQGQAFANALSVPDWFFEGDAVQAETALTPQGRGRLPYFLSGYQSLWQENRNYSWMKLRNGSLKDYVPDHYQLGYLLVNYGYLRYGDRFWEKVTDDASAFRGGFYPFQQAVKRHAGVNYKTFRQDAFRFYREKQGPADSAAVREAVSFTFFPRYIGTDSLLFLRRAYNRLPAFYLRTGGQEQKIALQSVSSEEWFSYRLGRVAYTAFSTHPRWGLVDYSDIVLLDLASGKERRLTSKARYYSPDFSPSGRQLAAVRITDSLQSVLELMDLEGRSRTVVHYRDSRYALLYPRFVDESSLVAVVRNPDATMELRLFTLDGNSVQLLPPTGNTIGHPFVQDGMVYFQSNSSGNDELYAFSLKDKKLSQLTQDRTGNYFPAVQGDSLAYVHFTASGLKLRTRSLDRESWTALSPLQWTESATRYPVAGEQNILGTHEKRYSEKRYRQSTGLFNFHSWAPNYVDPEFTFSLYSDNILSTFSSELYYRYNQNETSHGVGFNARYGGLFTMLNAGVEYTMDRTIRSPQRTFALNQLELRGGLSVPLNLTRGKGFRFLSLGSNAVYSMRTPTAAYKDSIQLSNLSYLQHFVSWQHYLPRARQHIFPRLGYTLYGLFNHALNRQGTLLLGNAQVFLPSIANHSLVLTAGFQETDTFALFSNRLAFSRGYTDFLFARSWRLSANYHFPLLYPDFGLANILYFQRIRANGFFDYGRIYAGNKRDFRNLRSVGGELYFDTKWWNQLPVTLGVRLSYLLDNGFTTGDRKGNTYFEVLLPLNLIPN
jgi:hypothetical protein